MTHETGSLDAQGRRQPDRRVHHHIRAVFEEAWQLIEPMLTGSAGLHKVTGFAIAIELRNHFPELSQTDLLLLVSAATKMQREGRPIATTTKAVPGPAGTDARRPQAESRRL